MVDIVKSASDDRQYRHVQLTNKLDVLLISDPDTDKASAAMDVHVGHFSDPDELPGLAHFLEHMLFLGTEKYPDEGEYASYLNANGGSSNAYTHYENTNYYFDVRHDSLKGALDRFSQFFIAPLFTVSATDRERQAVSNEHAKNVNNDARRMFQLVKTTANPAHPFSKFATGNLETLRDIPEGKGIDVRAALLAFHKKHYSSSIMKLVILGKEPLEQLEEWAVELFSQIPDKGTKPEVFGPNALDTSLGKLYRIVPVKDTRKLELMWPVPSQKPLYKESPCQLLSHLLGHEGKGSVLSYLKAEGLANGLSAGASYGATSCFAAFKVTVELTEKGLENAPAVAAAVSQYIDVLRSAPEAEWVRIFNEQAQLAALSFKFQSKAKPYNYATSLAHRMHGYPVQDVLSGPILLQNLDHGLIRDHLGMLTPSHLRVHLVTQSHDRALLTEKERWYGVEYSVEDFSPEWAKALEGVEEQEKAAVFALPAVNPYIATDFAIKCARKEALSPSQEKEMGVYAPTRLSPVDIDNDGDGDGDGNADAAFPHVAFFKTDAAFLQPKAQVTLSIQTRKAYLESPRAFMLSSLFCKLVKDSLNEDLYDASLAGLHYHLTVRTEDVVLKALGYNHKLLVLFQAVLQRMVNLQVDPDRFELIKEKMSRQLDNFPFHQPYQHADHYLDLAVMDTKWSTQERRGALAPITHADIVPHAKRLLEHATLTLYAHGNVEQGECEEAMQLALKRLGSKAVQHSERPMVRVVQLPNTSVVVHQAKALNPNDDNSVVHNTYQIGATSVARRARLGMLAQVAKDKCYQQLRTVEQLGYLVWSYPEHSKNVVSWVVVVQSSEKDGAYLDSRVEAFISQFRESLAEMTEEDFAKQQSALIAKKLVKDKTIYQEADRHSHRVFDRSFEFDRLDRDVAELRSLTKQDLIDFVDTHIVSGAPERRKMSAQVFADPQPAKEAAPADAQAKDKDSESKDDGADDANAKQGEENEAGKDEAKPALREAPKDPTPTLVIQADGFAQFKRGQFLYPRL